MKIALLVRRLLKRDPPKEAPETRGLADVDPQPMTQTSGEGIDPDQPKPPPAR